MKTYRMTLIQRCTGNKFCIYYSAETEAEVKKYFEENFNRFNDLLKITDVSNTKFGKNMLF